MNLKKFIIIIIILLGCCSLFACQPPIEKFTVTYNVTEGGSIEGEFNQVIELGGNTTIVTAIPSVDYKFTKWSDGIETASRVDKNITSNINVTAEFEKISNIYQLNYNKATGNNLTESIIINKSSSDFYLPVPLKTYFTFDGWYLESDFTTRVSDNQGKLLLSEIINNKSNNLYAKWEVIEKITYKILMVYVTEIDTILVHDDKSSIKLNYKLTATEKQICELATYHYSNYLNDLFDGLVTFEIDIYFTTEVVESDCIKYLYYNNDFKFYFIFELNEIANIADNYSSVITTFSLGYYENPPGIGGIATNKYSCVGMESLIHWYGLGIKSFDTLMSMPFSDSEWRVFRYLYSEEFIHSIEVGLNDMYSLHGALEYNYRNRWINHF